MSKGLEKDEKSIPKARKVLDALIEGEKPQEKDYMAYLNLRKKYEDFSRNARQLENPKPEDLYEMDSLTLDEVYDTIQDRKKILQKNYHSSISEIYESSKEGKIVKPTSGGLFKSTTPTNDFIDNIPDIYNPFDDLGVD
jgi:hypothetical protein